ncbi:gastrula zinc finger protein XlCGF26.1-like [Galleria mellonella]|uniref:Gastrula zinc finger protein XlCGF26.1-like n=1 Tax=Galleria mellonella TaxID=7137 RepID=A0A6J1X9D5_GALME|nr:gastrula zinc finger protein XlCGF26.1-like [Galleria mellonella]
MALKRLTMLRAFKFLTGENQHICRLCLDTTEHQEMSFEDTVRFEKTYCTETLTFGEMFEDLGVLRELALPQVLCSSCAKTVINSYLFKKLCEYSNNMWSEVIERLDESLNQAETCRPNIKTTYLLVNEYDNVILTSRNNHLTKTKKIVLAKIKNTLKSRKSYVKVKQKFNNETICEECGDKFTSNCLLLKHNMKVHHKNNNFCLQCSKVFATPLQVEKHAERVHYPKKIKCSKCSKMFSTERMLKHHDKLHHIAAICKLCFVQFPSKKDLRAHIYKHDVNKCPKCSKTFLNRYTFKFHLKICGNPEEKQPNFFCDICKKGYVRKSGLKSHLKTDHGFGHALSCNWCGKKFDAVSRLKSHIVKHTKERNFHCEQCGGKFVTQAALVYHTRLHTGERPFPCNLCNESFLSASRRMDHKRRVHFGPTMECLICHAKFATGSQLKKHVQKHSNPLSKLYVSDVKNLKKENWEVF